MKKVLSSILVGTMLISSMGAISIFADEAETSVSATAKANSETITTNIELGEAIGNLKENITKLEVKSFWQRNKGTILKVTGGVLAAAATAAALHFGNKYLGANIITENPEQISTEGNNVPAGGQDQSQTQTGDPAATHEKQTSCEDLFNERTEARLERDRIYDKYKGTQDPLNREQIISSKDKADLLNDKFLQCKAQEYDKCEGLFNELGAVSDDCSAGFSEEVRNNGNLSQEQARDYHMPCRMIGKLEIDFMECHAKEAKEYEQSQPEILSSSMICEDLVNKRSAAHEAYSAETEKDFLRAASELSSCRIKTLKPTESQTLIQAQKLKSDPAASSGADTSINFAGDEASTSGQIQNLQVNSTQEKEGEGLISEETIDDTEGENGTCPVKFDPFTTIVSTGMLISTSILSIIGSIANVIIPAIKLEIVKSITQTHTI
ncbi:MAG: hypothetical protein RUMPE_00072 [Eubacteriales bacterium SKADARSKE-1]|nr:hypothetical protein [Eubacteriales bacterium SKADARSKE-1]